MQHEHCGSKAAGERYDRGVPRGGRPGAAPSGHRAPAPRVPGGCARHRQDGHHGADRAGAGHRPGVLLHDAPHAPERARAAVHRARGIRGPGVRGLRVHHERDHRLGVRLHEEERGEARHPVPRRDQLRVRDALPLHVAVLAVQDVRAPCGARGVDHRLRRQPAGVQQVGARVRRGHARPREEDQRGARLRGVEGLRRVQGHAPGHPHVPGDQEEPLLLHRGVARRQVVRHRARLGRPVGHDGRVRAAGRWTTTWSCSTCRTRR